VYVDGMRVCKHFVNATQFLMSLRVQMLLRKTNFFAATFLISSNNNTTKFQLHLQFFAHAILLKAGLGYSIF